MSAFNGGDVRTVGLLHPGEMGAAIGAALRGRGHRVVWASDGRGAETVRRAASAGLEDLVRVGSLAAQSDVILSVVPPSEAVAVATALAGFAGVYVDANAISPETSRVIARTIESGGGRCVDGSIIGRPPAQLGDVRLYLSGADADAVTELFAGTIVDVRRAGPRIGEASAVKVAYAGWTKGTMALLLALREYAGREAVEEVLLEEWGLSIPTLKAQWERASDSATSKGWRWVGEMQEIASALEAVGLPPGFHEAAAAIFAGAERPAAA